MVNLSRPVLLIVEDEFLVRLCAVDAFDIDKFEVIEAEHAAGAILIAMKYPRIDLLFTDVNMPGELNGIELAEHLYALRPALKIIVTSALPLLRRVDHLDGYFLPKPYNLSTLSATAER